MIARPLRTPLSLFSRAILYNSPPTASSFADLAINHTRHAQGWWKYERQPVAADAWAHNAAITQFIAALQKQPDTVPFFGSWYYLLCDREWIMLLP